jgi:signal transduction histidine kinase
MQTSVFNLKSSARMAVLVLLAATVVFILWSLFQLVKQTEIDERQRMEVWALAQKQFVKDIDLKRLETITNRFSKIGSLPIKKNTDIVRSSRDIFDYLAGKASRRIAFAFYSSTDEIHLKINKELYCWVVENLLNNAIDAVVGEGKIELSLLEEKDRVLINVIDTGKSDSKAIGKAHLPARGYHKKKRVGTRIVSLS